MMGSLKYSNTKRQSLNELLEALLYFVPYCFPKAQWHGRGITGSQCTGAWNLWAPGGIGIAPMCPLKAYALGWVPRMVLLGGRGVFKRWDVEGGP